jgi:hypothetical protein
MATEGGRKDVELLDRKGRTSRQIVQETALPWISSSGSPLSSRAWLMKSPIAASVV